MEILYYFIYVFVCLHLFDERLLIVIKRYILEIVGFVTILNTLMDFIIKFRNLFLCFLLVLPVGFVVEIKNDLQKEANLARALSDVPACPDRSFLDKNSTIKE